MDSKLSVQWRLYSGDYNGQEINISVFNISTLLSYFTYLHCMSNLELGCFIGHMTNCWCTLINWYVTTRNTMFGPTLSADVLLSVEFEDAEAERCISEEFRVKLPSGSRKES